MSKVTESIITKKICKEYTRIVNDRTGHARYLEMESIWLIEAVVNCLEREQANEDQLKMDKRFNFYSQEIKIKELLDGYLDIIKSSDREMEDGDLARKIAKEKISEYITTGEDGSFIVDVDAYSKQDGAGIIYIVAINEVYSLDIKYVSLSKESAVKAALEIIKKENDDYKDAVVFEFLEDDFISGKEIYRLTANKKLNSNEVEIKECNKNKIIFTFLR